MNSPSILIVEDEALLAMDLRLRLEARDYRCCGIASSGEEAINLFRATRPDIVLMDINLGSGMNGVETYKALREIKDVPVVYLTAFSDPGTLNDAKETGPFGYLQKPFDEPTLLATLEIALARHAAIRAIAQEELKYRALLENAYDLITVVDAQGLVLYQSPSTTRLLARQHDPMLSKSVFEEVHPDDRPNVLKAMMELLENPASEIRSDVRVKHANGSYLILEAVAKNALSIPGVEGLVINSRDVTERRATEALNREQEAQAHRSQRLESLEVLAGGLAHDFNNLLLGILGNISLAEDSLPPESLALARLKVAEQAGLRAADLVNQMLAFAGKGRYVVRAMDLSALIREMSPSLGSLMPTGVLMETDLHQGLPPVEVDSVQLRQCLQALVSNSAEALNHGDGIIHIRSGMVPKLEPLGMCVGSVPEGPCVFVEVSDSGSGIPAAQLPRIFEPFFSTKFSGRGLGLAAALGIVRGHRGCIQVRSIEGEGTTFRIVLPAAGTPPEGAAATAPAPSALKAPKRVLVVDDEEMVRTLAMDVLARIGYSVDSACDGLEALDTLRKSSKHYGLVLLDLTMPNMGGLEVLRLMKAEGLNVPVLMTSGFALSALPEVRLERGVDFLQKPYPMAALKTKVAELFKG